MLNDVKRFMRCQTKANIAIVLLSKAFVILIIFIISPFPTYHIIIIFQQPMPLLENFPTCIFILRHSYWALIILIFILMILIFIILMILIINNLWASLINSHPVSSSSVALTARSRTSCCSSVFGIALKRDLECQSKLLIISVCYVSPWKEIELYWS